MASCDDDYPLLADQNQPPHHHHHHHHHQSFDPHRFSTPKPPPPPPPQPLIAATGSPKKITGNTAVVIGDGDDEYADTGFCSQSNAKCSTPAFHDMNPFSTQEDGNPFSADEESDPNKSKAEKRKDHDELSDGGSSFYYKKPKSGAGGTSASGGEYRVEYRGDYRKDREEWSDTAIGSLLDAYTEKFFQLNRGNLRGRDWEEVASVVSDRCDKQKASKSVEQCKNKVDNLKKRYKVERHRMSESGSTVSHWPWFKKMEQIVSSSALTTKAVSDDDRSGGGTSGDLHRQSSKRYTISTPSSVSLANNTKHKSLSNPKWRRVVFKVSGAALSGSGPEKIDPKVAMLIAREVSMACCLGVQVAIVVGGRNFFCGDSWVASTGLDRSTAYQIGMMATVMNSTLLQSALEKLGVQARVQTAFPMQEIAEPYSKHRAIRHLEKGRVVIFGGVAAGTGNPLFTTDTAAALRASELNADAVLKGTNVDGVYDCHSRNGNNVALEHISYRELVSRGVTSMDMMAITLCEENGIPVVVFNLLEPGNISRALCGNPVGTLIDQSGSIG